MDNLSRVYHTLPMAAKKMGCTVDDILHLGATNRLEICAYIDGVEQRYDYCTFNVFFDNEDSEKCLAKTIRKYNSIFTEMYEISLFNYNDELRIENEDVRFQGLYANHMKGFFAIPSEFLVEIELSGVCDIINLSPRYIDTPKGYGDYIRLDNIDGLSIPESRLVIFDSEISGFNYEKKPKYAGGERESPKTRAKKAEIIPALIKLIPEMHDVDLEEMPVTKIAEMIEVIAAQRGVELPSTHRQTWQKYLGRDSEEVTKRKK
ncbi:hypothetical protein HUK76_21605 [Citrobacter portucalensis]|uniref:hypothetical protein n=1 Tax=Citrobacter portucalensis TaxID=1639133 RepID=UPI00157FBEE8|nr:hypothetical protein [Citrobacter portucalensis]NUH56251.1 hypothetical protein [Citrobacter portucalensis]